MVDFGDELSDEEIDALEKPKESYEVPGTTKRKKFDSTVRTITNWFKLPHTLNGVCEVASHDESRTSRNSTMLFVDDHGTHVCRWCFIESRDLM